MISVVRGLLVVYLKRVLIIVVLCNFTVNWRIETPSERLCAFMMLCHKLSAMYKNYIIISFGSTPFELRVECE